MIDFSVILRHTVIRHDHTYIIMHNAEESLNHKRHDDKNVVHSGRHYSIN